MRLIDADKLKTLVTYSNGLFHCLDAIDSCSTIHPAAGEWHDMSEGLPPKEPGKIILLESRSGNFHICGTDGFKDKDPRWYISWNYIDEERMLSGYKRWAKIQEASE